LTERIQELVDRLAISAGMRPDQLAGVMVNDDREITLALANRISSNPRRSKPANRSRLADCSAITLRQIQPTDRHAIRISSDTAVLLVCTANHAT
jgi:hypothetical protein